MCHVHLIPILVMTAIALNKMVELLSFGRVVVISS